MTNRVIHQEYLEAWLRGESVEFQSCGQVLFYIFDINKHELSLFENDKYMFRITPKTIEVNLTDFYADYDKIASMELSCERGYDKLVTLIKKYLPRH